jgi:hypothetical protein
MATSLCQSFFAFCCAGCGLTLNLRGRINQNDLFEQQDPDSPVSQLSEYFEGTMAARRAGQVATLLAGVIHTEGYDPDDHEACVSNVETGTVRLL